LFVAELRPSLYNSFLTDISNDSHQWDKGNKLMPATQEFIEQIVQKHIPDFANRFRVKYTGKGAGLKNLMNKANNPFILALGEEVVIYSALMRSLDSSLGNRLEDIAKEIAEASYLVYQEVEGDVPVSVDKQISDLMTAYTLKKRTPKISDLNEITSIEHNETTEHKSHKSDYHLVKKSDPRQHFLLELKIGGDLDNKKDRSEKQALLEQFFAILKYSARISSNSIIKLYFATAYNKFGEEAIWKQGRVTQFFSEEELLIGRDFWNFVSDSSEGYNMVIQTYQKYAHLIKAALEDIIATAKRSSTRQIPLF